LKQQTFKPEEIIVIDDKSSIPVEIKDPLIKVIRNKKNMGLSFSRNLGVNESRGEVVAFIDDDAWAEEDWLEEMNKCLEKGNKIIAGLIRPQWEIKRPRWLNDNMLGRLGLNYKSRLLLGCNFAVKKEVLSKLNFTFNEKMGRKVGNLLSGEETELIFLAKEGRIKIKFCPKAVVFHLVPKERLKFKYFWRHYFWDGRTEIRRKRALYHGVGFFYQFLKNLFGVFSKPRKARGLSWLLVDLVFGFPYFWGMIYEKVKSN
jgi:glycosyltransferase involved in cell wall biosynthesis